MRLSRRLKIGVVVLLLAFTSVFGVFSNMSHDAFAILGDGESAVNLNDPSGNGSNTTNGQQNTGDDNNTQDEDGEEGEENNEGKSCYDTAGALGWILCTAIEALEGATETLYEHVIEPFLGVSSDYFDTTKDSGKGVYTAWQIFQNFANIGFAIMFLVVIISQLTGVGINNYGIKNILPRLIISAILINLSFIICSLLVDLSNVLGASLKGLFDNLAKAIPISENSGGGAVADSLGVVAIVVGGFLAGAAIYTSGLAVILPLLIGIFSAFISIFFLFLILGARQAGVVVLAVISPIAFACYMLPNTKKYFDKWKSIFSALLVLYPICGILIGGGNFAGKVLLSAGSGDFFFQLTAMLVSVVPFFFIPSLLRSSMNAIGNLGSMVSNFGNRARNRATGTIDNRVRNSDRFKDYERNRTLRRAEHLANNSRLSRRYANGENLSSRQIRRLANAQNTVRKLQREDSDALATLAREGTRELVLDDIMEDWNEAYDAGDTGRLIALTQAGTDRFGSSFAGQVGTRLAGKSGLENDTNQQASIRALQQYMEENNAFAGNMKKKAPSMFGMISNGGRASAQKIENGSPVVDQNGNPVMETRLRDSDYFTNNTIASSREDWAAVSKDEAVRAIEAGTLSNDMMENILADPELQSSLDPDLAKIYQAALHSNNTGAAIDLSNKNAVDTASQDFQRAAQQEQEQGELWSRHEEDAARIGKNKFQINGQDIELYAPPSGFNPVGGGATQDPSTGHYIFTNAAGEKWDGSTGRHI